MNYLFKKTRMQSAM